MMVESKSIEEKLELLSSHFGTIDYLWHGQDAMKERCWTNDSRGLKPAKRTLIVNLTNMFYWDHGLGTYLDSDEQNALMENVLKPLWASIYGAKHLEEHINGREESFITGAHFLNIAYLYLHVFQQNPELDFGAKMSQKKVTPVMVK